MLLSHQPQQAVGQVLLRASSQDVIYIPAALDVKSLTDASHCHDQSQKSHQCSCVHGLKLKRRSNWCWRRKGWLSKLLNFPDFNHAKQNRESPWFWFCLLPLWCPGELHWWQEVLWFYTPWDQWVKTSEELEKCATVTRDQMVEKILDINDDWEPGWIVIKSSGW